MPVSRTKRTLQNSKISLLLFLVQIFVGFYSRKIFLDYLGDEVIGLNTTLGNILSFLNLAELGIGIAMATSLYKPIHNNNQEQICEIITVQGILYKRIAILLCLLSIPVIISLPFIFPSTDCSLVYIYIAYIVFLSGSIFSYLWNYREVLIQADQKNFILMPWIHGVRYVKLFAQIVLLLFTPLGVWGWIGVEFVGNIATVFVINHVIRKEYPWFHKSSENTNALLCKYSDLMTKTKQLFVHKIGSFVLEQTAPLIIYTFVSLTMVTFYGNYMMLIGYTVTLMNVIFEGMGASIGNLVAENNQRHTLNVFWELFSSRVWIAGVACFGLYVFIGPFISIWIGNKYVLSETTLLLLIIGMFIRMTRSVVDSFKNAYQLFGDVWSPIVEASINLGCSILFGYLWGLNGIILGSNLSLVIIVLFWKPYYTFRYGLKASSFSYYVRYVLHVIIIVACAWSIRVVLGKHFSETPSMMTFALDGVALIIFTIATFALFYIFTDSMRQFTVRLKNIALKRI